ncbi:MAG: hypothetical protein UW76_C0033G0002 [Parcubacteria group bacterium GW2011_GWF2_44_8b]|nr:MAG: hypothetical protein UV94_C0038G0005 [Parcubacteria group bacterium GW2011_GWC1_43_30]KKT79216.1 MAG: hypothetical protein UW76_C0033G0002 [Parcubacteria group bacterium GW2011_GWF2_44_8b]
MQKAVFLDRDGSINKEVCYLHKLSEIEIMENVPQAIKKLKGMGYLTIVVSNQPVIAKGLATEKEIKDINEKINELIKEQSGFGIDRFYFCPHHPDADLEKYRKICNCRKPSSGLLIKASEDFGIDLKKSWMIGDRISDIVAGNAVGCRTILIETDYSNKKIAGVYNTPNEIPGFKVKKFYHCINIIK